MATGVLARIPSASHAYQPRITVPPRCMRALQPIRLSRRCRASCAGSPDRMADKEAPKTVKVNPSKGEAENTEHASVDEVAGEGADADKNATKPAEAAAAEAKKGQPPPGKDIAAEGASHP
mmetsp:Transcript_13459/g.40721  ORF Transcript_13459/g.40721 Transcript_13459/m.40721 type:complete len:121 (+) Transcript_13459:331-693(+)